MRKFGILTLLSLILPNITQASPTSLGGYHYKMENGRIAYEEWEDPAQLDNDPEQPYYLEESDLPVHTQEKYKMIYTIEDVYKELEQQEPKNSINFTVQEEKYKTPPVYSVQDLYNKRNKTNSEDDEAESDSDDSQDEE